MAVGLAQRLVGDDAGVLADRNFQLLLVASLVSPMGETVVSPVLESLSGVYAVGEADIGLVMAAYTAPAIVLIPVVGAVSDRIGRKPVLVAGLALIGVAGVALPLTTDFRAVLALRGLQGVGYTGVGPILVASLGDLYEGPREATAQGLRFTAVGVALTGLPLVAGTVGAVSPLAALWLFVGAVPVAAAVAVGFTEPTGSTRRDSQDDDEDRTADDDAADGGSDDKAANAAFAAGIRRVGGAATNPGLGALLLGRGVPSFLWFVFLTYASTLAVGALAGSTETAGSLVAAASVAAAVGTTQVGRVTAAAASRATPFAGALLVACAGLAAVAVAPGVVVAGGGAVAFGAGFGVALTLYRSTLTTRAPEDARGGVVSLGESLGRLGSTAGPVATGWLIATLGGGTGAVRATVLAAAGVGLAAGLVSVGLAARTGVLDEAAGPTVSD